MTLLMTLLFCFSLGFTHEECICCLKTNKQKKRFKKKKDKHENEKTVGEKQAILNLRKGQKTIKDTA